MTTPSSIPSPDPAAVANDYLATWNAPNTDERQTRFRLGVAYSF